MPPDGVYSLLPLDGGGNYAGVADAPIRRGQVRGLAEFSGKGEEVREMGRKFGVGPQNMLGSRFWIEEEASIFCGEFDDGVLASF